MYIAKLKIKNLKKFHGTHEFLFDKGTNILVGDNDSGKTTLLEALEMVLNSRLHGQSLTQSISTDLFNNEAAREFLQSDKSAEHLPEILIEAFLEEVADFTSEAKLRGSQNSDKSDSTGVCLRIRFNSELSDAYSKFLKNNTDLKTLPIEFFLVEWYGFDWKQIHQMSANFRCIAIDPTRIHPSFGRHQYIKSTLSAIGDQEIGTLNLSFRQLQAVFAEQKEVQRINDGLDADCEITEKNLSVVADISSSNTWERNLQLAVNKIRFEYIGKGEQTQILLMLALSKKLKDAPFVLIEEPENHLSHLNLVKSIERIERCPAPSSWATFS
ncbi:AAA family ATPase [Hyphococcus sp.]|uniref:AAA family ATPase n=1 Tax=Hyphococcus sp. TaxID=2038636 RepID=UPI003CCBAB08